MNDPPANADDRLDEILDSDRTTGGPVEQSISVAEVVDHIRRHPFGDKAEVQRRRFARFALGRRADEKNNPAADVTLDGEGGTIVYFHGGGYAFGSPHTHARIGRGLSERTGLRVVLPSYPLSPEQRWPAQLEVAVAAVTSLDGPIILAGDSAGGHLALVTALALSRRGKKVAGLLLFSPNTDRSGLSTTRERNDPIDPMVDDAGDRELARQCFGALPVDDREVSPVLDDMRLLPSLHLEVGAYEVLRGDSEVLATRARAAGCDVTLHIDPDGVHMGQLWAPWWPTATASLDRASAFALQSIAAADLG